MGLHWARPLTVSSQEHTAPAWQLFSSVTKPAESLPLVHQRLVWLEDHSDETFLAGLQQALVWAHMERRWTLPLEPRVEFTGREHAAWG